MAGFGCMRLISPCRLKRTSLKPKPLLPVAQGPTSMAELLTGAAALIMLSALVGLVRVLRGPTRADRLLAAQLLSTAGIGALLLLASAGAPALIDVALVLALVGAFASVAFVMASRLIERR